MKLLKRFVFSDVGKGTAGVFLADLLIACPPSLSWLTAGCLLWWAIGQFRRAFRSLDTGSPVPGSAEGLGGGQPLVTVVLRPETTPEIPSHTGAIPCSTNGSATWPTS